MSKVANTYLDNTGAMMTSSVKRNNSSAARAGKSPAEGRPSSKWISFAVLAGMTFLLCVTINFRAYTEMSREMDENQNLSTEIDALTSENLALQEEIHDLKSDSRSIEREARRIGLSR